jgi:hypothetical protein
VVKTVVAAVGEGASTILSRGFRLGSGLNQADFGARGKNSFTLDVGFRRRELEQKKFRIFLKTRLELLTLRAVLFSNVVS